MIIEQTAVAKAESEKPVKKVSEPSVAQNNPEKPKGKTFRLNFSGSAGEYFRIWIVNIFLTIITFGTYAAWAKVRTRRYFYAHTKLAGNAFDYHANPVAILKGNMIIGVSLFLYSSSDFIYPGLSAIVAILFGLIFPFLIYKSLRFYAHNSSFRNIRFCFNGKLKESYITYLIMPLLIPFTMGLITPYWAYRRKQYFFNNFALGKTGSAFSGRATPFYYVYAVAAAMAILVVVGGTALFFGLGAGSLVSLLPNVNTADGTGNIGRMIIVGLISSYLVILLLFTLIQQYIFVRLTNYCWHHSRLGKILFKSSIQVRKLVWIRITNILAIIFSFGLMTPWAKVRRTRYILDSLTLIAYCNLDEFTAAMTEEKSAVGEAATDFFDFEIGL